MDEVGKDSPDILTELMNTVRRFNELAQEAAKQGVVATVGITCDSSSWYLVPQLSLNLRGGIGDEEIADRLRAPLDEVRQFTEAMHEKRLSEAA